MADCVTVHPGPQKVARARYGSWTHHLPHHSPYPCPTLDTADVAACDGHPCWAGPTWPDDLTRRRWGPHLPRGGHRRREPALCLQMGPAVSGAGCRGIGRQTSGSTQPWVIVPIASVRCPTMGPVFTSEQEPAHSNVNRHNALGTLRDPIILGHGGFDAFRDTTTRERQLVSARVAFSKSLILSTG